MLGETEIPAIVVDATEADCLVMSLVENIARRQHRAIDLMQEIGSLSWSPSRGQVGGNLKLDPDRGHAANWSLRTPSWTSAGVRPPNDECGRRVL